MKRKITICLLAVVILIFFSACALTQPDGSVTLQVICEDGNPIANVTVYAGNYPDGREPWPPPEIGSTDAEGKVEFTPVSFGTQPVCIYDASKGIYLYSGEIEVDRADIKEHKLYTITAAETNEAGR